MRLLRIPVMLAIASCASAPAGKPQEPKASAESSGSEAASPAEQVHTLELLVVQHPENAEAWQKLGIALRHLNRLPEAARASWRRIELGADWQSWKNLANVLMQGHARKAAWAALDHVAESAPAEEAAQGFLNLGYQFWIFGEDEEALRAIERAERLTPKNPLVFYDRANVLASMGRTADGTPAAKRAVELLAGAQDQKSSMMRTLLDGIQKGDRPDRPPPFEAWQVLPAELSTQPASDKAVSLPIPARSRRFYGVENRKVVSLEPPATWNEEARLGAAAQIVYNPGASGRFVIQVTAIVAKGAVDIREAAQKGAQSVTSKGGKITPLQPLEGKGAKGFWFAAEDSSYDPSNPNDYKFLVQGMLTTSAGVVVSATLLTNNDVDQAKGAFLDLLRSVEAGDVPTRAAN